MTSSLASGSLGATPGNTPMSFSGRGGDFLKLLVAGSLLQIPTFGFYRFWLLTKLRRHLWSNTRVAGEAFEYTGTAKELLVGFLIAAAILVPIYAGYFALSIMAEEMRALASIPLIVIIYVLAHFAGYRARRYRASRTIFRGLRFWMTGTGWGYAARAILCDFAVILTLGLALPWTTASLERYRMRHTWYGNIQGDFVGTGGGLFKAGWWVWALGMALLGPIIGATAYGVRANPENVDAVGSAAVVGASLVLVVLGLVASAIFTRWQMAGLRFGEVVVASNLRTTAFLGPFGRLLLASVGFTLTFAAILAAGGFVAAMFFTEFLKTLEGDKLSGASVGIYVLLAVLYLVFVLGAGILSRYFLGRGMWAVIVNSVSVSHLSTLDSASAAGGPSGVIGEGFADALDFEVGL